MKVYFVILHFISTVKVKIRQISSRMVSVSCQEYLPYSFLALSPLPLFPMSLKSINGSRAGLIISPKAKNILVNNPELFFVFVEF